MTVKNRENFLIECKELALSLTKENNLKVFYARTKKVNVKNTIKYTLEERKSVESLLEKFPDLTLNQYVFLKELTNQELTHDDLLKFKRIRSVVRCKRSRPTGIIITFTNAGETYVGWSNFFKEDEVFNKYIGIYYAFKRACLIGEAIEKFKKNAKLIKSNSESLIIQPRLMTSYKFILEKITNSKIEIDENVQDVSEMLK